MWQVITAYKFLSLGGFHIEDCKRLLTEFNPGSEFVGLVLLASEGVNFTVAGNARAIDLFKIEVENLFGSLVYKESESDSRPFRRYSVQQRDEIVAIGEQMLPPEKNGHLTPEQWHNALTADPRAVLIDTRNTYEVELGKFKGAIDPRMKNFQEFPAYVDSLQIEKTRAVYLYCTGGIRCEKAALVMNRAGFQNVFQLHGGILNYLERIPNGKFEGECFVFDKRVSVDENLKPSIRYALCPHCGDPGDLRMQCAHCGKETVLCARCVDTLGHATCSKNCRYHDGKKKTALAA